MLGTKSIHGWGVIDVHETFVLKGAVFALFFLISSIICAQSLPPDELVDLQTLQNFATHRTYSIQDGMKYNDAANYSHADFGKLTFKAPHGKNVVEVLSKRKIDERYYVDLDDPLFFYIQKSSKPINFLKEGDLLAIDPALRPVTVGLFKSGNQPVPTALDLTNKCSVLDLAGNPVKFNSFEMKLTANDNAVSYYDANWSNISIGNFSVYITDIFPSVDMRMIYGEASVKSEFIIKENLDAKEIRFIDHMDLGDNLGILIDNEDPVVKGFVQIYNIFSGETQAVFRPALTYDSSTDDHEGEWTSEYELSGEDLSVICDSVHLNDPLLVYPLIVDPTFTAVGPVTSGFGLTGSLPSPAFCSTNLDVTFPGGSTPWDTQITWWVWTAGCSSSIFNCWMSEAQVWITSSCGGASPVGAPGIVWVCPGCNTSGSWNPTLPFNNNGTQSLAQCYAPDCADQTLTFTINLNRTWCTGAAGVDNCTWGTSTCQSMDQWEVTVQGRSIETLGNTATGNGSQTLNDADCVGTFTLDPTQLYGVPPYTFSWSTGETTATITVAVTPAIYTCTVTDGCGTSVVATFTVSCPLDNEEMNFTVEAIDDYVRLDWMETAVQIDRYIVERSANDGVFKELATVPAAESITGLFRWFDVNPFVGNNFYRIKLIHASGLEEYSPIEKVEMESKADELVIIPNPSNGAFSVNLNSESIKPYEVVISDVAGREVVRQTIINHDQMDLPDLADGVYVLSVFQNQTLIDQQRLILKK